MWEIYVNIVILDCARWYNIGLKTYAFYCKLQAITKMCTGYTCRGDICMYIHIKNFTHEHATIRATESYL